MLEAELGMETSAVTSDCSKIQRYPRIETRLSIDVQDGARTYSTQALNMSTGGLFIALDQPPEPGATVTVDLSLGSSLIHTLAEVIWNRTETEPGGQPRGCGVQFLAVRDRQKLERHLESVLRARAGEVPSLVGRALRVFKLPFVGVAA